MLQRFCLGLATLALPAVAHAESDKATNTAEPSAAARFGQGGSVALAVDGAIGSALAGRSVENPGFRSGRDLVLTPRVDAFLSRYFSLGVTLPAALRIPTGAARGAELWGGTVALRGGALFRASRSVALWTSLEASCGDSPAVFVTGPAPFCAAETFAIALDPRLVIDPFPHVFLTVSPLKASVYPAADVGPGSIGPVFLSSSIALGGYL